MGRKLGLKPCFPFFESMIPVLKLCDLTIQFARVSLGVTPLRFTKVLALSERADPAILFVRDAKQFLYLMT